MQWCKCLDINCSGERTPPGTRRAQQEAVPTGPMKGITGGKIQEFHLAGIELYDKKSYSSILIWQNFYICFASCSTLLGPNGTISPLWWMSTHLHHCMEMQGGLADDLYLFSVNFHPARANLSFRMKQQLNVTVVRKLLTNHKWVVAWQLLDTACPVLLMRGGIPQTRLTA